MTLYLLNKKEDKKFAEFFHKKPLAVINIKKDIKFFFDLKVPFYFKILLILIFD